MSPLGIVVLIVLIDLLGFTVVMPLLAPFAEQYGFREWQIGLLFSAFPLLSAHRRSDPGPDRRPVTAAGRS